MIKLSCIGPLRVSRLRPSLTSLCAFIRITPEQRLEQDGKIVLASAAIFRNVAVCVRNANKHKVGLEALLDGPGRNVVYTAWTFHFGDLVHGERNMIQSGVTLVIGDDSIHSKLHSW